LAKEGAKVVISSRKESKVKKAVENLQKEDLNVHGLVCHVGKTSDRQQLVEEVNFDFFLSFTTNKYTKKICKIIHRQSKNLVVSI
jgi:hypothetical protein